MLQTFVHMLQITNSLFFLMKIQIKLTLFYPPQ